MKGSKPEACGCSIRCPVAQSKLPTPRGEFEIYAFCMNGREHLALVKGKVSGEREVPLRVHSRCVTGDVFGSYRCDCGAQLQNSLSRIEKEGRGILLYLDQEGRGIGLYNKIKAYALQDRGMDTVEANLHLGFCGDERDYADAAKILRYLKPESVILLTNNPDKSESLKKEGIAVSKVEPLRVQPNEHNKRYLQTKKDKMRHAL